MGLNKFQFITLPASNARNFSMFELARGYKAQQMTGLLPCNRPKFAADSNGYTGHPHHP